MFAVAHPTAGSRLLAQFDGVSITWTPNRDLTTWYAERKDARSSYRLAWTAAARERKYRLESFREQERAARELSQSMSSPMDEKAKNERDAELLKTLARLLKERAEADEKAQDAWLDSGSEAVLFEKPDSLLSTPGFSLFGFVKEGGLWACFDGDGALDFSDSGARMALFQTEDVAFLWGRENLKSHPDAAIASLRAEIAHLKPVFELSATASPQWISDVLGQQDGALAKPDQSRGQEPMPQDRKRGRALALGKKERKEARDKASGRFEVALPLKKERKAGSSRRPRSTQSVQ